MSVGRRIADLYQRQYLDRYSYNSVRFAEAAGGEIWSTMCKILDLEEQVAEISEEYERASLRDDDEGVLVVESLDARRTEAQLAIKGLLAVLATL